MKENLLHFLWRYRRFVHHDLKTTEGDPVEILDPGMHNLHAGADFSEAQIRIGGTLWAGHVEMHLYASEWLSHGHQHDRAYDNVILHVVLEEDKPVFRADGSRIPCLEMKTRIPPRMVGLYEKLHRQISWIPCQQEIRAVPASSKNLWLDRLLVERLEQKTKVIRDALLEHRGDWEQTFYRFVARNFGLKINVEPFEMLAVSLPLPLLARHRDHLFQLESLLFGQAGMLDDDFDEEYPLQLKREFHFLQKKYDLHPLDPVHWKFLRLHPANFPTIRLAQFARLIHQSSNLFSQVLEARDQSELETIFQVQLDGYWLTHYTFRQPSARKPKSFGKEAIRLLTINTIAPFLFLYGAESGGPVYQDRAFSLLENLPPEQNVIIRKWKDLDVEADSAYRSQALLQLKNNYCDARRCLSCGIGTHLLSAFKV